VTHRVIYTILVLIRPSVVQFFRTNPDEFLTTEDVADKFEVPLGSVHRLMEPLVLDARAQWGYLDGTGNVYAGPAVRLEPVRRGWRLLHARRKFQEHRA
jgi:hypothetical protein